MTDPTIVAVYDKPTDADAAVRDLEAANVPSQAISRHDGRNETTATTVREKGFWARLFGSEPNHDTSIYDRSIDSGSSVVAVRVPSEHVDHVSSILETHHPIDLDERSAQYLAPKTTTASAAGRTTAPATSGPMLGAAHTPAAAAPESGGTIQLAEESLAVGKRAVSGATTRIRRFVVETPVREQVNLRDEAVTIERRSITDGRTVETADFTDKVIEMTEMSEEPVISKTAHVIEEVSLRKNVTDRAETVTDTLRRDEVEIEKVPGESASARTPGTTPITPALSPKT